MICVEDCTGLILAGGQSKRMGCDKALLQMEGKSLLQRQVEKFQNLGVKEILISGPEKLVVPGIRTVPDIYPGCGPVGGLHAGLLSASCDHCLVIGVDMPLVPEMVFHALCDAHEGGVTILSHSGGEEPLLGIYDRMAAPMLENMILRGTYTVRKLMEYVPFRCRNICGLKQEWLCNCNYPEDYAGMKQFFAE